MRVLVIFSVLILGVSSVLAEEEECDRVDFLRGDEVKSVCLNVGEIEDSELFVDEVVYPFALITSPHIRDSRGSLFISAWDQPTMDQVCEELGFYPLPGPFQDYVVPDFRILGPERVLVWNSEEGFFQTSEGFSRNYYRFIEYISCPTEPIEEED